MRRPEEESYEEGEEEVVVRLFHARLARSWIPPEQGCLLCGAVFFVQAYRPALYAPTINRLSSDGWCLIESVVNEERVREIILPLKSVGAEGSIEIGPNKVVP